MIISIDEELLEEIKQIVKSVNVDLYKQLEQIEPITNSLQKARDTKTARVKQSIKETIKSLSVEDKQPTKYQIHKSTGIAYITLNKYYDSILEEFKR